MTTKGTRRAARRRAFTLVEVIAAMAVIATLGSVAAMVIARAADAYNTSATAAQVQAELSAALDRIERHLRMIPGAGGTLSYISAVTPTSLTWTGTDDECSLSLSGGQVLLVMDAGAPATILTGVTAFSVACADESGAAMAGTLVDDECEDIRRITIAATVSRSGITATGRTGVFLRCTMAGAAQ